MTRNRLVVLATLAVLTGAAVYMFSGNAPTQQNSARPAPAAPVTTAVATSEDFAIRRRTIGILESPATVVVKSRLESQVAEQKVRDGQLVKQGDVLFTLDDRAVLAAIARSEAQLARDQATADRTQLDLERYQRLAQTNATSAQQLDQATAENKIALSVVEAGKAQLRADNLQLEYTKIVAPISGRIGAVRVTPGNLVSVNDPTGLVTITQITPIRAAFTLAERDLAALRKAYLTKPAATVRAYTPGVAEPVATGTLSFIDSSVDTTSGTIAAKAEFANKNFELWPGSYVDIEIDLAVRPDTIMVPAVAIQSGQSGPFVFVVTPDNKAAMRRIELVGVDGQRAALASGVKAGEQVIIEGQMRLVEGTAVNVVTPAGNKPGPRVSQAPAGTTREATR